MTADEAVAEIAAVPTGLEKEPERHYSWGAGPRGLAQRMDWVSLAPPPGGEGGKDQRARDPSSSRA